MVSFTNVSQLTYFSPVMYNKLNSYNMFSNYELPQGSSELPRSLPSAMAKPTTAAVVLGKVVRTFFPYGH